MMKEAVDDLGGTMAETASAAGAVGGMVDSITQAINKLEDSGVEPDGTFVDYQTTMVKTAKAIAVTVQEMVCSWCLTPCDLDRSYVIETFLKSCKKKLRSGYLCHPKKPSFLVLFYSRSLSQTPTLMNLEA